MTPDDLLRRRLLQGGLYASGLLLAGCGNSTAPLSAPAPGTPVPRGPADPRGVHLSWREDPLTSRTVTWFTDDPATPAQRLDFGPVTSDMSDAMIQNAPFPASVTADTSETPFVEAFTHQATARDLQTDLPMRYRVGSDAGWSPVRVVPPTPTGDHFRFVHFGDHGRTQDSRHVARAIRRMAPDFALLAGDLSYASGSSSLGPQEVWDEWFDLVEAELGAETILMTAAGNHENEGNNGVAYRNRMAMPTSTVSPDGTFYTFQLGRVQFIISTGGAFATDGTLVTEILFLETQLARAALRRAAGELDFIVVSQHFTIWTDQEGRGPANFALVALQENIFVRYGVDLLAVGHDHIYQRSHPMSFGLRNPLGYVQITSGCGGVGIRGFEPRIQNWSAKELAEPLFVEYVVSRGRIDAITHGVDSETGDTHVVDTFTLERRGGEAASAAVLPVRDVASLHPDYDRLARRTMFRNRLLLARC